MGAVADPDGPATAGAPTALARLFALALRSLVDDLHERLAERGWADVRPTFGFVLLATRQDEITVTELGALLGTTKQAASKLVAEMTTAGYLEAVPDPSDARRRPVRITERGEELLVAVELIYEELEAEWADLMGRDALETTRRGLMSVMTQRHSGRMPPIRPAT